ncbi:MAG TPA: transcription antitermination factor NusB [Ignavibacteriales bacterium]|jgi:N utilization substance protein B|nr:transcription antitermination factor NusB [Ignavibacteriales bacterium]
MPNKRHLVRETVLSLLYTYEFNKENYFEFVKDKIKDFDQNNQDFANKLINKTILQIKDFDSIINSKLNKWELDRVPVIDRIIIRMGICEIMHFEDIPPKVTINEMIELAKEYSNEKSSKFVNGILDSFLNDLQKNNQLNKTGRGLIEQSLNKKNK